MYVLCGVVCVCVYAYLKDLKNVSKSVVSPGTAGSSDVAPLPELA